MKKEYNIKVNTGENTLLLVKGDDDDDDDERYSCKLSVDYCSVLF